MEEVLLRMEKENNEVREIRIDDLVPFKCRSHQTYERERLEQLMNDIERSGQMHPIIVRPVWDGEYRKYEIISGHNRAEALKELGCDRILAEVRDKLSDDDALQLFYDIKLSKQSFSDWSYSQKIEAIRYYDQVIRKCSQQGKRTDLEEKGIRKNEDEKFVKSRQKLEEKSKQNIEVRQKLERKPKQNIESRQKLKEKPKRLTTRDKVARRLDISTAAFSMYRRFAKLPDNIANYIGQLLDRKIITLKVGYMISKSEISELDMSYLLECIEESPDKKVDMNNLNP